MKTPLAIVALSDSQTCGALEASRQRDLIQGLKIRAGIFEKRGPERQAEMVTNSCLADIAHPSVRRSRKTQAAGIDTTRFRPIRWRWSSWDCDPCRIICKERWRCHALFDENAIFLRLSPSHKSLFLCCLKCSRHVSYRKSQIKHRR